MNKLADSRQLRYIAVIGNGVYILWIVINGINEGFKGTRVQIVVLTGLIVLLLLNSLILIHEERS